VRAAQRGLVSGVVQGVGFRPSVARLARALGLTGEVANRGGTVEIVIEGESAAVTAFIDRLHQEAPSAARIAKASWRPCAVGDRVGFAIAESGESDGPDRASAGLLAIGPDLRSCGECLAELDDPGARRTGYSFTSCTACGPRLTVAAGSPWDRRTSAMAAFPPCEACAREFADPSDRRWHAEAIACPRCGPSLWLEDRLGRRLASAGTASIETAAELLRRGEILGLKGLGGFQLLVDAADEAAVRRLRTRKQRPTKPLALMVPDLAAAASLVHLDGPLAREVLTGPAGPILLLPRQTGARGVADAVAPGQARLGVMLPTTPAHALLLRAFGGTVVATSGNIHDRPIAITTAAARVELGPIVDALLLHDRPILRRCDDSVVQIVAGQARTLRLGRGLAPAFFTAPACAATILALGGDLQAAPVLAAAGEALAWPHVGDLRDPATRAAMLEAQADLCRMVGRPPEVLACDAHPDSVSAVWAHREPGARVERVFHHHAHVAATLAERGRERALGVAWDGAGMGEDRSVWGGEFLAVDPQGARRLASLRPFALPGGDAAARDGLRPLVGLLVGAEVPPPPELLSAELHRLFEVAVRPRLSPPTSSVGRLFDAFACLLGLRRRSEYQAQAAIELEQRAAAYGPAPAYPFDLGAHLLDWRPALRAAIAERREAGLVAARLHATLIAMIVAVAERHRARVVALAGGCFANAILLGGAVAALEARGIEVLAPSRLPPGDGGLALGQAWVVGHRLRAEVRPCA